MPQDLTSLTSAITPALQNSLWSSVCKENFYSFVQRFWHLAVHENPVWNWHIEYLCYELQNLFLDVEAGRPKQHDLIINLPPGSSKCAIAGSTIRVPDGFKLIEDIKVGDTVLSCYDNELYEQKVINTGFYTTDCVKVESVLSNPIICSKNHPFMTQRGWVNAEDLTTGDYIQVFRSKLNTNTPIPDPELDFITLMLFEGSTTKSSKTFTSMDYEMVEVMRSACTDLNFEFIPRERIKYQIKHPAELLQKYGIDKCLAKNKRLPKQFYSMPIKQKYRFISLMLATDGYVENGGIAIELASEGLINDIKFLLAGMGIMSSVKYFKGGCYGKDGEKKEFDRWRLHVYRDTCQELFALTTFFQKDRFLDRSLPRQSRTHYYFPNQVKQYIKNGKYSENPFDMLYTRTDDSYFKLHKKTIRLGRIPIGKISKAVLDQIIPLEPDLKKLYELPYQWSQITAVSDAGKNRVYHFGVESKEYDKQNYFLNDCLTHNSTLFSILFPCYVWARMPSCRFITASFQSDLAEGFARKSKQILKSDLYRSYFHRFKFFPDRASNYRNQFGGERLSFTTGTSPTGYHAHFILIDDPIDPLNQDRTTAIANVNTWMHRVIRSRVVDARVTPLILIMQRLSVDDPTGEWLEQAKGASKIRHISLPASIESGQIVRPAGLKRFYKNNLFDPIRLPASVLEQQRNWLGNFDYKAQYDQNPLPREGLLFKVQKLHIKEISELDPVVAKVRYWDKAISTNVNACFTVGVLMGKTANGKFVVMDVKRGQWNASDREQIILDTAKGDGPDVMVGIEQEPGPIYEEEMVLMRGGFYKPLKEIKKNDYVINKDGEPTKVLEVHIQGDLLCRNIVSGYHDKVWAALSHPFITPEGDINAGDLVPGSPIYIMENFELVEDVVGSCRQEKILPCRCLTVENGASFVVNDFVVHNSGGMESAQYTVSNLAGFRVYVDRATQAKEARAEPMAIQVEHENVSLLEGNWNAGFISELSTFPRGKLKDQVDAAVGAFRLLCGGMKKTAGPLFDPNTTYRLPTMDF